MSSDVTSVRIAQTIGIVMPALIGGGNMALSWVGLPPTVEHVNGSSLIRTWKDLYNRGMKTAISLTLVGTVSWAYVLYKVGLQTSNNLYMVGGLLGTIGITPYTLILMAPGTNARLEEMHRRVRAGEEMTDTLEKAAKDEVVTWAAFNYGRAAISIAGFVSGIMSLW